jgi:hypothetical protein
VITGIITWLLRGWLSRWALTAEGEIKAGWRWLTTTPVHLLTGVLAISAAMNLWQWHTGAACKAEVTTLTLERDGWRKAEEVTRKSNDTLTDALHQQNDAVDHMKTEADKRVQAGQAALGAAKDRSAVREGLAARIEAQRAPAGAGEDCRTNAAVMAAKGQL